MIRRREDRMFRGRSKEPRNLIRRCKRIFELELAASMLEILGNDPQVFLFLSSIYRKEFLFGEEITSIENLRRTGKATLGFSHLETNNTSS
ncbi:hypothetical protein SLA2020_215100 [Shorea laevis]